MGKLPNGQVYQFSCCEAGRHTVDYIEKITGHVPCRDLVKRMNFRGFTYNSHWFPTSGTNTKNYACRRHSGQMPKLPQPTLFDVEEHWLCLSST